MASVNRVILIGNLGGDPESRLFADGSLVCNIRIATTERWRDRTTGTLRESTEWHRVTLYRRLAEVGSQYLRKGSQVYLEGRLCTKKWTDSNGMERQTTEIEATNIQILGRPVLSESAEFPTTRVASTIKDYPTKPKSYPPPKKNELENDFDEPPF